MEITSLYRGIAKTPAEHFAGTVGMVACCYRPSARDNQVRSTRLALDKFWLMALRPQWGAHRQRLVPSVALTVHQFQYNMLSGRVVIDAGLEETTNCACWDVAVPRSAGTNGPHTLNVKRNETAARCAITMHQALTGAINYGHPAMSTPAFPDFYSVFPAGAHPAVERTPNLRAAIIAARPELAAAPPAMIPDEVWRDVFRAHFVRDGDAVLVPHWLLSRDPWHRYVTHPRTGAPCPVDSALEYARSGDWVMLDGKWTPVAQQPRAVVADLTNVLGRESLAAWEILVDTGQLPPMPHFEWSIATSSEEWEQFRETKLTELFPGDDPENPLVTEWKRRNVLCDQVGDEEVYTAFSDVRWPTVFQRESKVSVVALQGYPSPENLRWELPGLAVDLFQVRQEWSAQAPLTQQEVDRLQRGFPINPRGGQSKPWMRV
jgi:hypothetical protein